MRPKFWLRLINWAIRQIKNRGWQPFFVRRDDGYITYYDIEDGIMAVQMDSVASVLEKGYLKFEDGAYKFKIPITLGGGEVQA
jgi:hypothetical protein